MDARVRTKIAKRPPRDFPEDIGAVLQRYGHRARVVQLWRQVDGAQDQWTYFGRLAPEACDIMLIAQRFGGGWYRAKIFGAWNRDLRREEYLEQVTFGIAPRAWPLTAESLTLINKRRP